MARERTPHGPPDIVTEMSLCADPRNLVWAGYRCHAAHHNRSHPYELRWLPDSAYEFAAEVLGPGRAYEYLRRRYTGPDVRLDALLAQSEPWPISPGLDAIQQTSGRPSDDFEGCRE